MALGWVKGGSPEDVGMAGVALILLEEGLELVLDGIVLEVDEGPKLMLYAEDDDELADKLRPRVTCTAKTVEEAAASMAPNVVLM